MSRAGVLSDGGRVPMACSKVFPGPVGVRVNTLEDAKMPATK